MACLALPCCVLRCAVLPYAALYWLCCVVYAVIECAVLCYKANACPVFFFMCSAVVGASSQMELVQCIIGAMSRQGVLLCLQYCAELDRSLPSKATCP